MLSRMNSKDSSAGFSSVLMQKAEAYLQDRRRQELGQTLIYLKAAAILILYSWSYIQYLGAERFGAFLGFAVLIGISHVLLPVNVVHDAVHGVFSKQSWINRLALQSLLLVGCHPGLYQEMHLQAHSDKENGSRRKAIETQQLLMKQKSERSLPAIFYLFYAFYMIFIRDFILLLSRKEKIKALEWVRFVFPKVAYFLAIWVAPFVLLPLPPWQILIGVFSIYFAISILLIIILLMPTESLNSSKEDANQNINDSWLQEILLNNVDFSPRSYALNFLVGGANMNVAHYIFPNISHIHYVGLAKIIRETAEEFHLTYRAQNVVDVFGIHWRYMMELGNK